MNKNSKPIKSYRDLEVYENLYRAMLVVLKEIIPMLPREEKYDLVDQMRRCAKGMPALIAEGFAKRYQAKAWHKYLEDVLGEINEILHHLDVCLDVYSEYINQETIKETRNLYEIAGKQVYRLKESWKDFHEKRN